GLRVVGTTHEDADAAPRQGSEGVLVSNVVAQIDGDHLISVQVQRLEQVEHRLALIPVQPGLYLKDHLARRDLELLRVLAEDGVNDLLDAGSMFFRYQAEMSGDRTLLGLDQSSRDVGQLGAKLCLHLSQQALE